MPRRVVRIEDDAGNVLAEVSREDVMPENVAQRISEARAMAAVEKLEDYFDRWSALTPQEKGKAEKLAVGVTVALARIQLHMHDKAAPDTGGL